MAITRISVGAFTNGLGAITPTAGTFAANDVLLYLTGESPGSGTIATPAGWTALDANTNAKQTRCFAKVAVGGDTMPTVNWSASIISWALVLAYRGVDLSLAIGASPSDRQVNATQNITGPAGTITPSVDNCLVLFFGQHNKTATSDGTSYSAPANFTLLNTFVPNGTRPSVAVTDWIQTTATAIAPNTVIPGTIPETVAATTQGSILVLKAATGGGGGTTSSRLMLMGVGG